VSEKSSMVLQGVGSLELQKSPEVCWNRKAVLGR
jgi:hypothetical protein